jgi:hypothetical protein
MTYKNVSVSKKLVRMDAVQTAEFFDAIRSGKKGVVRRWCNSDFDFRQVRDERGRDGKMLASMAAQPQILSLLLNAEIRLGEREMRESDLTKGRMRNGLNNRDVDGMTAQLHAWANGHTGIVQLLAGSYHDNIWARQKDSRTGPMLAAMGGHTSTIDLIGSIRELRNNPSLRHTYLTLTDATNRDAEALARLSDKNEAADALKRLKHEALMQMRSGVKRVLENKALLRTVPARSETATNLVSIQRVAG